MYTAISDTETTPIQKDGSTDGMWIFGWKVLETGEVLRFEPFRGQKEIDRAVEAAREVDHWVGHNFLEFDLVQIHKHVQPRLIDPYKVTDTLILSRLIHYARRPPKGSAKPHSLEAWGIRLGVHKGTFSNFEEYSQEMVDYWGGDLDTTEALYNYFLKYINDPEWHKSIKCEHDVQIELTRQSFYGFQFNKTKAEGLLTQVQDRMTVLEAELAEDFPPKLKLSKVIQNSTKSTVEVWPVVNGVAVAEVPLGASQDTYKGGQTPGAGKYKQVTIPASAPSESVLKAKAESDMTSVQGDDLACYNYVPFNPGSPVDRIDVLWEAKWKPFEKTKTHQQFGRLKVGDPYGKSVPKMDQEFYDKKLDHFKVYGWSVNEDNLATLPDKAPAGAKKLAQWLTLEGRRSSLVEWIGQVRDDGRIHGRTQHIGAWTGRGSHKSPNTANISSVWPDNRPACTPVEEIKKEYDTDMRSCWEVPNGSWLVGVDAEGIQLRILGDQLWKHFGERDYADAIVAGRKEDETDIHNVNKRALLLPHLTRDDAKTFIYAWVLNAGLPKIASILKTNVGKATNARNNFEASIKGLKPFKDQVLPAISQQSWFKGYDGRKVVVPSLHKTLAGILQNGEAVVMKHSQLKWAKDLKADGVHFKPLTWVHDEWQTEVVGTREDADHVRKVQIRSIEWAGRELGFRCQLDGSGSIGLNWAETH
jgi:hypothetical protein